MHRLLLRCPVPLLALTLFLGTGTLPATALAQDDSPEERAKVRVFEALDLMDAGSYGEARLMLQLALGLNASLDRAWYYLAQCNVELGNWDEASDALSRYEAADLSEHERMQIVDLRGRIQAGRGETISQQESAEPAATEASTEGQEASSGGTEDVQADEAQAASATQPKRRPVVQPGPILMAVGGVVAGVGAGLWAHGASLATGADTYASGEGHWYGGIAMLAGGGATLLIGIPVTIRGKSSGPKIAFSMQPGGENPSTAVYLIGRW